MHRLPERTLADYAPIVGLIAATVLVGVLALGLAFHAGQQSTLQTCLAARLDSLLQQSDSLVRLLREGRQ